MSLFYSNFSANQRTESADWNATNQYALGNLARAIGAFLGVSGIYRGGKVKPTAPVSKAVIVEPLAGIAPSSEMLLLPSEYTLAVPDNGSGNPRIDLVSIGPVTSDYITEPRFFWNPATEQAYSNPATVTAKALSAVAVLTVGTPAANPVAPATPAGHIALARVYVADGFTSIDSSNITRLDVSTPLIVRLFAGGGTVEVLPYTLGDPILSVSTQASGLTLLFAQVHVASTQTLDPSVVYKPLIVEIEAVASGAIVGRSAYQIEQGGQRAASVWGLVTGPQSPAKDYRLRFSAAASGSGQTWASGFTLLSQHDTGVPTQNVFGALSL